MKIFVHQEPKADFSLIPFCAVINVADTPCRLFNSPVPVYWYPIQEMEFWSYGPFFFAGRIIDEYRGSDKPILIHCHAGVNRSASVAYAIYESDRQCGIDHNLMHVSGRDKRSFYSSTFENNIRKGHIPADIIPFLKARHEKPAYSLMGLIQHAGGPDGFNNLLPQYYHDLAAERSEKGDYL